ncbi:1-aminocyclopropane-1-carboxylate synthase [Hibiscus syriacus]|uniref:1-aminocyclopropane-1-carboxylate synthase n=1 Tax=Hibiscus syriacus TaxID=106335 RepID=A0A6A3CFH5_HIBSY|nr:1-aminocyclopropane-1-carboxylate synthase [Hibiscus syriacus]
MKSTKGIVPDTVTYNCLIDGFSKTGEIERGIELFEQMKEEGVSPNMITVNILIDGMCRHGRINSALELFGDMQGKGVKGNSITYTTLITAFSNADNFGKVIDLFDEMVRSGYSADPGDETDDKGRSHPTVAMFGALIHGYCLNGKLEEAWKLFNDVSTTAKILPNTVTYNILIESLCKVNDVEAALSLMEDMKAKGDAVLLMDSMIENDCHPDDQTVEILTGWLSTVGESEKLRSFVQGSKWVDKFNDIAMFQDYHGLNEFRQAVAKFMGRVGGNKVTFDPNRIVISGGATAANETVMFCLADPRDAFLVPSPYYAGFSRDLRWRTGLEIVPVDCKSSNNLPIMRAALEDAYQKAQTWNINVKGVIIVNPSNPLGTILDPDIMRSMVSFVNEKNIHLVCDEIYTATVFSSPRFISIAEIIQDMDNCNRDLIHIVYSLFKDIEIPGFRVGIVYSFNDKVMRCARRMSSFGLVSLQTHYLLASMLSDDEFVGNFLRESSKRLAKRHNVFTKGLQQVGISCLTSNAGLFFWMDMRPLLKEQSLQGELELWRVITNEVKLNVSDAPSQVGFGFAPQTWTTTLSR